MPGDGRSATAEDVTGARPRRLVAGSPIRSVSGDLFRFSALSDRPPCGDTRSPDERRAVGSRRHSEVAPGLLHVRDGETLGVTIGERAPRRAVVVAWSGGTTTALCDGGRGKLPLRSWRRWRRAVPRMVGVGIETASVTSWPGASVPPPSRGERCPRPTEPSGPARPRRPRRRRHRRPRPRRTR